MKQLTYIFSGLMLILLFACGQEQVKSPDNALEKFEEFKRKEKFIQDSTIFYPGIGGANLRPALTEKINLAADDFQNLALSGYATAKDYQDKIETGLKRFSDIYIKLDTEDRERICTYYEELMDIVGLESSGGRLNDFMNGFDPTQQQTSAPRSN